MEKCSKMKAKIQIPTNLPPATVICYHVSKHFFGSYPDEWDDIVENDEIINVIPAMSKAFGDYKFIYKGKAYWIPYKWLSLDFPEITENFICLQL